MSVTFGIIAAALTVAGVAMISTIKKRRAHKKRPLTPLEIAARNERNTRANLAWFRACASGDGSAARRLAASTRGNAE